MKLSVIIPTLNEEKYLETTLFHIDKQAPDEIIVADSHSKDNTIKIAKKFGCRVVYADKGNAAKGRNAGGRAATGDILVFVDADTILFPNVLETIRNDFKKKDVVGWTCLIYAFTNSWKDQIIYNMSNNAVEFLTKYMKKPHAPGIIIAVRKETFEKVGGFDENLKVMEDHDFAMKVGKLGKFKFSKDTCVFTSTRRMEKWGGWGLIKKYSRIYLSYFVNKKGFDKNHKKLRYEPIR